ncbi:MAG: hypothetical protein H6822_08425 [Planctomycetaceae bacterium]|nr:hypothetical protein [Planctomycetales bacterium]MCB9922194.1 hypothetical protein [Planctomycetaceae bacterium]
MTKPIKKAARTGARAPEGAVTQPNVVELQRRNVEKLLRRALKMADPLQGAIGVQSSQLLSLGNHLHSALEEALANAEDPLDKFSKLLPSIEAYLKINRQFDRFARLNHDLVQQLADAQRVKPGSGRDQSEELRS